MHLNDSKAGFGSGKDRHENIGMGQLSLLTFQHIVTDSRLHNIPLILETPNFDDDGVWKKEVEVLHMLSGTGKEGSQKQLSLEELTGDVKKLVEKASGGSKKTTKARAGKKKKNKASEEQDEVTDEED